MTEEIRLGKYIIIRELGRGGFGIVYEAHDTSLDRLVALKALHPNLVNDMTFLSRFKQEAKLAARLEHPNIVPVHEFNQADGRYYIVMGLMTKGSLGDLLEKYGPRSSAQTKSFLEQVLNGMAYAHERGVIHRDLKPGNILIDEHNMAKIADFGFAKAMHSASSHSLSATGGVMGTPAYMAPEIWRGKDASARSDIYSLGCIAYEMLTGKPLFDGESAAEIMTKHVIDGPSFQDDLPAPWRKLIEKCLAKNPSQRYQTAKAVLEDLKFGLFDAPQERESEIVLSSMGDKTTQKAPEPVQTPPVTPPRQNVYAPRPPVRPVSDKPAKQNNYYYQSPEPRRMPPREDAQRAPAARYSPPAPEVPTPGQMLELSPLQRLRKRLPWLLPLSLGVIITLGAVVLFSRLKGGLFAPSPTETPTATASPTLTPTAKNTSTATRTPTPTNTPTPALGVGSTMIRLVDGMEMVYVPEGTFTMGSDDSDAYDDEQPVRNVYLDAYWIDKFQVSNAQYALCVEAGECTAPYARKSYTRDSYYGNPTYDNYPVIYVDWNQASAYCTWAGGSLPSEAEWEKAARGPNGSKYPWGDESPSCSIVNYWPDGASKGCVGDTTAVGSYPDGASYYGALDMAGNVWEWVNDWYANSYDANDTNNPTGPNTGTYRVLRGGSWDLNSRSFRSANRGGYYPFHWSRYWGFRCVFPQR